MYHKLAWNLNRKGAFAYYSTNARGSGIIVNDKCEVLDWKDDNEEGRIVSTLVKIREKKLGMCSIYAPNVDSTKESKQEYSKMLEVVNQHLEWLTIETKELIVGGDLNIIFDKRRLTHFRRNLHLTQY